MDPLARLKLFRKVRHQMRPVPERIYCLDGEEQMAKFFPGGPVHDAMGEAKRKKSHTSILVNFCHKSYAMELSLSGSKKEAVVVHLWEKNGNPHMDIYMAMKGGKKVASFDMEEYLMNMELYPDAYKAVVGFALTFTWWLSNKKTDKRLAEVEKGLGAHIAERIGDTMRYQRVYDYGNVTRGKAGPLGHTRAEPIEHSVRGFWRQFKNGNKVWVRPHTRGNPEVGHLTTIQEIQ